MDLQVRAGEIAGRAAGALALALRLADRDGLIARLWLALGSRRARAVVRRKPKQPIKVKRVKAGTDPSRIERQARLPHTK